MLVSPSPIHKACMRLREHGVISFAPNIVPYATIDIRAEQWVEIMESLTRKYSFEKFNIVAHSMAGLDMRYAINHLGVEEKVASLTTIATPHRGSSLAELVLTAPDTVREKLGELADWFGESIYPHEKSDAFAAVEQLTREYITNVFNPENPDPSDIPCFSYSAAVGKGTAHPLNPIYRLQNQLIFQQEGPNDAFVTVESAIWATHIETLPISHLEQIDIQVNRERRPLVNRFWMSLLKNLQKEGL